VTLNVSGGALTPYSYGAYSDGIIEVLGQSRLTDLRYVERLVDEVHRSVVYVQNASDYTSTSDKASDLSAVIDGLHIAFDDASAWLSESLPFHHGLCLTQAGHSVVRRLVINADCKIATANAGVGISATTCLVRIRESYNTLDEFQIHNDTSNQGTVYDVIAVGGHNSDQSEHHNILNNGKLHIHWDTDLDPGTAQYPQFGISVSRLSGCLISGVTFYMEGNVPAGCAAIHSGTDFTRVVNCHVDVTGNCTTEDELLSFTSGAAACIAMGNILRCRSGMTTPAISAAVGVDVGNLKLIQALPAQPSE